MNHFHCLLSVAVLLLATACTSDNNKVAQTTPIDVTTPDVTTVADLVHNRPVVVDFYATWCGPCKQQSPIIDRLEAVYPQIEFRRIDVDQNERLARSADVSAIPTILFVTKDGIQQRFVGLQSYETLDAALKQLTGTM